MANKKAVLAYSGGLDTSVAIRWIKEEYGYDVIAVGIDLGEDKDPEALRKKAEDVGAVKAYMIDAKEELADEYVLPSLKANALYEGKYPLSTAIGRPLIVKLLVDIAHKEGAVAIAHGCTGKGNDQVRFEVCIRSLDPTMEILAPVRDWGMSRDEEIAYAKEHNIPIPITVAHPYSIDANIWGRACEAGVLEDPWTAPPKEAYGITVAPEDAPDAPDYVEVTFEQGKPVALDGREMSLKAIIDALNELGGAHGVGRIDHIENRLVGIKSREIYECPAAMLLIQAHQELEFLTLPRETAHFKPLMEQKAADLIYDGLWFSPLMAAVNAFIEETQKYVSGTIRVKLYKGTSTVVGRKSAHSLYNEDLATYSDSDTFDHKAAEGFIKLWGLSTQVHSEVHRSKPILKKATS